MLLKARAWFYSALAVLVAILSLVIRIQVLKRGVEKARQKAEQAQMQLKAERDWKASRKRMEVNRRKLKQQARDELIKARQKPASQRDDFMEPW